MPLPQRAPFRAAHIGISHRYIAMRGFNPSCNLYRQAPEQILGQLSNLLQIWYLSPGWGNTQSPKA
jgi:hypothetical protein